MSKTVAKYQKYPEYQDSGVEWLGEIPSHWKIKKLVWFFFAEKGKNGQLLTKEYCGLNAGEFPVYSGQTENNGIMGSINTYEFDVGDNGVLFSTTVGAKAMTLSYLRGKFSLSQNCMIIKPRTNNISTRFYYYHCQPLFTEERALIPEHMQASFRVEDLYSYRISLPPIIEQIQIGNFLDHETAKIDTLIAKQEKLIELLKEKRQAVISHVVTKGLNPDVAMKDSGVEWLGEVPEHWKVRQLRYLGICQNGINIGAEYFGSGSPFISYGDVYRNSELPTVFDGLVQSTENDRRIYSVQRGDVLFTRTSETIEEIGFSSTCLTDIMDATFAGFLIRFRPIKNTLLPEYSKFYFRNILLRTFFVKEMNLVTRASLSQELLKKLAVPFPNLDEQKQIASFLNMKDQVFDKLIDDCKKQIELLKERRTALISAAVTGKIDVRDWQAPKQQSECATELIA